jgi:hypothetical protein
MKANGREASLKADNWFTKSFLRRNSRPDECLICSSVIASERRAIHSFLYEGMMSPSIRERFLAGGGFCRRHAWMAKEIEAGCWPAGDIGLAILGENLVGRVPERPEMLAREGRSPRLGRLRSPRHSRDESVPASGEVCLICADNAAHERSLLAGLEDLISGKEWNQRLESSPLCLKHAEQAERVWRDPEKRQWARTHLERTIAALRTDLKEFLRKSSHPYRDEPKGREQGSVPRTLGFLAGRFLGFPSRSGGFP